MTLLAPNALPNIRPVAVLPVPAPASNRYPLRLKVGTVKP